MTERDFEKNPYSKDEERVARWISDRLGVGGGDDPIGFLIGSHEYLRGVRDGLQEEVKKLKDQVSKLRMLLESYR